MTDKVKESGEYENFLGEKVELDEPASLMDFVDVLETNRDDANQHWVGMPSFIQEDNPPHRKLIVSFRSEEDYQEFAKLINQHLTKKTKSIWHPKLDRDANTLKRWVEDE